MAHFAKVENNIVTNVIVAEQEFIDSGAVGDSTMWIRTEKYSDFRKNFAGVGYEYIKRIDAFVPPKPFDSWALNETIGKYEAPKTRPTSLDETEDYVWNESLLDWEKKKVVDILKERSSGSI